MGLMALDTVTTKPLDPLPTWVLISDVDDTLLGDDSATRRFAAFVKDLREELLFVMNSSRFVDSQLQSVDETPLPTPDLLIGGMGSQIQTFGRTAGRSDLQEVFDHWTSKNASDQWAERVEEVVSGMPRIEPQPAENQSQFKRSFYLRDAHHKDIDAIADALSAEGFDVELTYSSDRDLDILPRGINKASAASFVATTLGYDTDHVVVSGDSGNDRPMLTAGFRAIVVGNAKSELKDLIGPRIYRADRRYADGVIEGLTHWMTHATASVHS